MGYKHESVRVRDWVLVNEDLYVEAVMSAEYSALPSESEQPRVRVKVISKVTA